LGERPRLPSARSGDGDRDQRPPRSLPGDPRARRLAARGAVSPARESADRPPRGRVLRRRARRPLARHTFGTFRSYTCDSSLSILTTWWHERSLILWSGSTRVESTLRRTLR